MLLGFKKLHEDEEAATMVEYGVIVGLIATVAISAISLFGGNVSNLFRVPANAF